MDQAMAGRTVWGRSFRAVMVGGLTAGALDISYAIISWSMKDVGAVRILQSVASGLLGKDAYTSGMAAAGLGGLLHFAMTTIMAWTFVEAERRNLIPKIPSVVAGPAYGLAIYLVMNLVVLPLSRFPGQPQLNIVDAIAHMLLVGLPIALVARRWKPAYPDKIQKTSTT